MAEENNQADQIIDRIRRGSALTDSRGRRLVLPDPVPPVSPRPTPLSRPSSFKKGGVVQKTGFAKLHRGELVLTNKQAAALKMTAKALALKTKLRKKKSTKKNITKKTQSKMVTRAG